jgi:hypothetical protein
VEHLALPAVGVGKSAAQAQDALAQDDLRWGDSRSAGHWRVELCRPDADQSAAQSYVGRELLDVAALPQVFAQEPVEQLSVAH